MRSKFKDEHPFEKRKAEAERIRQKYADRIPVSINIFQNPSVEMRTPSGLLLGAFIAGNRGNLDGINATVGNGYSM